MAEIAGATRPRINWRTDGFLILLLCLVASMVALSPSDSFRAVKAAPMSLTFENTAAVEVSLGDLASRSKCGALTKQGVGPYTMSGTDSRTGTSYSYVTNTNYGGAGLRESAIATSSMSYSRTTGQTYSGKSNVLMLTSTGGITWSNSCNGNTVYGATFGPEVYTAPFQASAGQALSFNWAAAGGDDDYEVYAFLVKVSPSGASYDYGGSGATLNANTTLLAHGRGTSQGWRTSTGAIPVDGFYRFRFVNGSYDASGGKALGATMYIDPSVLVGQANNISFSSLNDRVTSASPQTFTISASATSGGAVTFTSSTTGKCTVGNSSTVNGASTATVTLLASQTGLCTITADSASVGDYATAASVARSFTILAAPTAPSNSGGTTVTGTAAVGSTLTAVDGSWADGGSAITGTSYQWQVCPNPASCVWADVANASASTFLLGATDVSKQFRVRVSKTNGIGTASATSGATATVAKGAQSPLTISTTSVAYGTTLTLLSSGGSGAGAVTYAFVSGTCTVSGNTLTPGNVGSSCVVKATKAADSSYNVVSSSDTTITVDRASQSALTVTSTSGTLGVGLTLATSGGSGNGAVSYSVVSGACSVSGSTLTASAAGSTCVVKATKAADTNYSAISSSDTTVTFAKGAQSPLVISSVSAVFGIALNLTTSGGSGTGSVSYSVSSGSCSVLGSILTVGDAGSSCEVVATKAGDDDYLPVSSAATPISTAKATQSALTITSTSATFGQNLALTISGGSGTGAVSFIVVSGTCSLNGSLLTPGNAGSSCVVKATKATDTNYNERSSSNTTITIAKANQAALTVTSTSGTFGVGLALTTSGGSGTGAVSFDVVSGQCAVSGSTLTASSAGSSCVVKATKASDTNFEEVSSSNTTVTFAKGAQSPLLISSVSAVFGVALNLTTSGGSGTGSVSYSVSSGSCNVLGSILTVGDAGSSCEVVATKAGDDDYLPVSSVATSISTAKATQSALTITSTSATFGRNLALTTSGGSGTGAVSFIVVSGTCSVNGSSLTPGNVGSSCVVKATKATDTNYNERSSSNTTITIGKANQTGLNVTSSSTFVTGSTLSLTAAGGQSTGALSWSLQSGSCVLSGSTLSASRGGIQCVVEVTRAGDTNYFADSVTETISVTKIPQLLTFRSSPSASPVVGSTYTVTVDSDVSLAPTIVIANSSSTVCSISAGVVTFNSVGSCLISASQAGSDVYSAAAASQSVTVIAAPVVTTPPAQSAQSGMASATTTLPIATTTLPQTAVAAAPTTTAPAAQATPTTTTTTTTTTIPADPSKPILGADGEPVELGEGETTVLIRGEQVVVTTTQEEGQLVLKLPNDVVVRIGAKTPGGQSVQVGSDGVLRVYRNSQVAVELSGLVAGTTYTIFMFSTPIELGRGSVLANGAVSQLVTLPDLAEIGSHTLQVNGVGPGGEVVSVSMGIKVEKKQSNTAAAILAISAAILLALLGGRPVFARRRRDSQSHSV